MQLRAIRTSGLLLLAAATFAASPAFAIGGGGGTGIELLVQVNSVTVGTAVGGADTSTNTPLDILVAVGDSVDVFLQLDANVDIRMYDTLVELNSSELSFLSGTDLLGVGFSLFGDPNLTLADGTPNVGDADSNLCASEVSCPSPTNPLYSLSFQVEPGFLNDAVRDLSIGIQGITFAGLFDSLDASKDTVSLRLTSVPEPGTALLLMLGLGGLARMGRSRR